jgi:hypothetical protein
VVGCSESVVREEREDTSSKDREEIRSEIGKVTGMVADMFTMDSLGKSMECLMDGGCSWKSGDIADR